MAKPIVVAASATRSPRARRTGTRAARPATPRGSGSTGRASLHPELRFRNHGIWGERTDEIAARFDDAVDGADVLIVQGGINDIAQGRPVEPAAANLRALVERGLALGLPRRRLRRAPVEQRLAARRAARSAR